MLPHVLYAFSVKALTLPKEYRLNPFKTFPYLTPVAIGNDPLSDMDFYLALKNYPSMAS